jgi:competence protein ComGC
MKNKGYTLIELLVVIFFLMILAVGIIALALCIKGCGEVQKHGLKGAVTQIWEGPTKQSETKVDTTKHK